MRRKLYDAGSLVVLACIVFIGKLVVSVIEAIFLKMQPHANKVKSLNDFPHTYNLNDAKLAMYVVIN